MVLDIGQVTGAPSNMELTIEQALQQAVDAHKAGRLQDAERLYMAILQAQPKHPDANHNLGVLAVSVNKAEDALPFFSTALEANTSQGQFWLSYIDALIKVEQFDNAKEELSRGTSLGLAGEIVDYLEAQLAAILSVKAPESSSINKKLTFTQQRKKVSVKKEKLIIKLCQFKFTKSTSGRGKRTDRALSERALRSGRVFRKKHSQKISESSI